MRNRVIIVQSMFYQKIADVMTDAAVDAIKKVGCDYECLDVPGVFEIPAAVSMAIASKKYDAFVALGCVIRGETSHYDYVCSESARGLSELAVSTNSPIGYGIITAENVEQAIVRADKKQKNVGGRAAYAAIRMLEVKEQMSF